MRPLLALIALAFAVPVAAQQQDEQVWLQVNTNVPVADRWRMTLEQIARFGERAEGLYQTEFGGLIGYKLTPRVELGGGYRKVGFHNGNTAPNEDRLRQQVVATFGPVTTRLRVDELFLSTGGEVGFRVRPLLRYSRPVGNRLAVFVSHESFFLPNSTRWGQRAGYERMRNLIGVTVPVGRQVAADIGYLNQYRFARGGAPAQMDDALNLQLTINLDATPHPLADD